ncbi:MAG: hypothetical protein IPM56_10445 [Ignavibacteriales bacterium]|nr:MAG: hypothetical protein IPM56_10445 [Ignavibacteriales bacterium]
MKKILLTFFSALILISCGEKKEETVLDEKTKYNFDSTDVKTTTVENPDESFLLAYNFEPGKTYSYRLTSISDNQQTVVADTTINQGMKRTISYLLNLKLINKDEDGLMDLSCTFTSIKLEADAANERIQFESSTVTDSLEKVKYSDYLSLTNNPFELRINKSGEIIDISKTDRIINTFLKLRGLSDSVKTNEKAMMKNDLNETMLKPVIMQIVRTMPAKNMAKDSTWTNVQPASRFQIFQIVNKTLYKVLNLEMFDDNKLAVIDAGLETQVTGDSKYEEPGVKYNFRKPVTTASGKIYFNIDKGCLQKSRTQTQLDTYYSVEANTPKGLLKGYTQEKIKNTNIVELLK